MRHPTEGVLRQLLDEPSGISDAEHAHIGSCPQCQAELSSMREDADLVAAALATVDARPLDVATAWQRLDGAPATPVLALAPRRTGRLRGALRRPAVAGVAVAVVLAGATAAAATDWLPIFRTERVAPIGLSTADLNALPDLRAYGVVEVTGAPDVRTVDDADAAEAETGLDVPEVADLPRGVSGIPTYQVGGEVRATFTFSADRAARAAAESGDSMSAPPPGLDGSRVQLIAGPGVASIWTQSGGMPSLVVGRAVAPRALSSGVPFETMRDYLLSLPGMPDDVAAQLRTFGADDATLPLPVPAGRVRTSEAQVNGAPATVLATRDRTLAAVVWVDDGVLTAVAGPLGTDEVLAIARGLR